MSMANQMVADARTAMGNLTDSMEKISRANEDFSRVAQSVDKVVGLISKIAMASQEQAEGIENIRNTVPEMNRVVETRE
jgi:methyl-accepting chemotaxis protein